jgi:hypothetical protein
MERTLSPLEKQAAAALRRARSLPVGADRNDLRQLAMGLLWLHRNGMEALMKRRLASSLSTGLEAPRDKHANGPLDSQFGERRDGQLEDRTGRAR